jgi:putative ABC transport system permease protein
VAASLILGGFGIWNMMMSAVRSRTREIGLKKAMGAKGRDILSQFLTESLSLSMVAALVGVLAGRLGVELISLWLGSRPSEVLFFASTGLGLAFAMVIGVGAGLYPSLQASRMTVVHALRYE